VPPFTPQTHSSSGFFRTTPWQQLILQRRSRRSERKRAASEIYQIYWRPLYCLLLRRGFNRDDAQDLTQTFLIRFIGGHAIARADPQKGRFRDYLVGALEHFLRDQRDFEQALKRGGGLTKVSLDDPESGVLDFETAADAARFGLRHDAAWAARLLTSALDYLEVRYVRTGRGELFRLLKPHLIGGDEKRRSYWKLALRLRRPPATLRKDVERMRSQLREIVREELRQWYGPARVEEELQNLREILWTCSGGL